MAEKVEEKKCEKKDSSEKCEDKWVLLKNDSKKIKKIKLYLEEKGFYDKTRLIDKQEKESGECYYAIPIITNHLPITKIIGTQLLTTSIMTTKNTLDTKLFENCQIVKLETSRHKLLHTHSTDIITIVSIISKIITDLKKTNSSLMDEYLLKDDTFFNQLYTIKIHRYGDLVILSKINFDHTLWTLIRKESSSLWSQIAKGLRCSRIAIQNGVLPDSYRSPNIELVYGESGWVETINNGVVYVFDVTRSMFSLGNISEKMRMASLDCNGETILDLYAGIGYFTLPLLVHSGATCVHACEWNPTAVEGLRKGLKANGINEERCVIYMGDNRKVVPKGLKVDRIILGLIPSSEEGWSTACMCLNNEKGGWIHVHANVTNKNSNKSTNQDHTSTTSNDVMMEYTVEENEENTIDLHVPTTSESLDTIDTSGTVCTSNSLSYNGGTNKYDTWSRWAQDITLKFKSLLTSLNSSSDDSDTKVWSVTVGHIEHVKSYAPHVDHIVVDLECRIKM